MGPSGAGKSSLLNVLAGRSASAAGISISGKVSILQTSPMLSSMSYVVYMWLLGNCGRQTYQSSSLS